jgi:hypothetical protein
MGLHKFWKCIPEYGVEKKLKIKTNVKRHIFHATLENGLNKF